MNYLQLAQRLRSECEIPGTGPSTVVGQSGQLLRLANWIADAYEDIQNQSSAWRWLRRPFTLNTVNNDDSYAPTDATDVDAAAPIARFSHWWTHDTMDPYTAYLQSAGVAGQYRLVTVSWEQFKWLYRFGSQSSSPSQPIHVAVDHQNNLVLGPKPNGIYVIGGDFQRSAQRLTADADIPEMPIAYHLLIVYHAMAKYGANSVASEVFARAQLEAAKLGGALRQDQLEMMAMADALI